MAGMGTVVFKTNSFKDGLQSTAMSQFLHSLYTIDLAYLSRFKVPPLYESGIVYRAEPRGQEVWKDVPNVLRDGYGDCEDLACWRAAELRHQGVAAHPVFRIHHFSGLNLYHILVKRGNMIEDPSARLGMRPVYNPNSPYEWRE